MNETKRIGRCSDIGRVGRQVRAAGTSLDHVPNDADVDIRRS